MNPENIADPLEYIKKLTNELNAVKLREANRVHELNTLNKVILRQHYSLQNMKYKLNAMKAMVDENENSYMEVDLKEPQTIGQM